MRWIIAQALDRGVKRKKRKNQDAICVVKSGLFNRKPPALLLADGMGGHRGGAEASRLAVSNMRKVYLRSKGKKYQIILETMLHQAHKAIKSYAAKRDDLEEMGSTAAVAILTPAKVYLANVGDSRVYLVRNGVMKCISRDHSYVQEMLRNNVITPEQARNHPRRSQLTMSINARRQSIEHYYNSVDLEKNDQILLCSDGLWGVVEEPIILQTLKQYTLEKAVKMLVKIANAHGGPDNISILLAQCSDRKLTLQENEVTSPDEEITHPGFRLKN